MRLQAKFNSQCPNHQGLGYNLYYGILGQFSDPFQTTFVNRSHTSPPIQKEITYEVLYSTKIFDVISK